MGGRGAGLRETKKQRTRAMLIDAAIQLCKRQGFEHTTVDQIAALAGVSTRTFSRYFATKEAVILSLVDDMTDAIAEELVVVPPDTLVLEALLAATIGMLVQAKNHTGGLTSDRLLATLRIVNSSPPLQRLAIEVREHTVRAELARRMRVGADDRTLHLVLAVWGAVMVNAYGDLGADGADQLGGHQVPQLMIDRLNETYARFTTLTPAMIRPG
jgi:AcrR family transcriptional regulator